MLQAISESEHQRSKKIKDTHSDRQLSTSKKTRRIWPGLVSFKAAELSPAGNFLTRCQAMPNSNIDWFPSFPSFPSFASFPSFPSFLFTRAPPKPTPLEGGENEQLTGHLLRVSKFGKSWARNRNNETYWNVLKHYSIWWPFESWDEHGLTANETRPLKSLSTTPRKSLSHLHSFGPGREQPFQPTLHPGKQCSPPCLSKSSHFPQQKKLNAKSIQIIRIRMGTQIWIYGGHEKVQLRLKLKLQ